MNLSDNLKKIRKEHNLSQEQLADKLGVSRQSVSKWESNQAYPEMDKVLQICKMFNVNIDELMNQDINSVKESKQSKSNLNKYVKDLLEFMTKTVDMFCSMKFKDIIKCLIEQLFVVFIIWLVFVIIGGIGNGIFSNIFHFLPLNVYEVIYSIFSSIYILLVSILGIILFLYVFKIRYLDYYVIIKDEKGNNNDKIDGDKDDNINDDSSNIKNYNSKREREKIIIRDPDNSGYRFFNGLVKCLIFFVKLFVIWVGIGLCFSLVSLVILLVMSFMFVKVGLIFFGVLLILISSILINVIVLDIIYNFVVNRKIKKLMLFIMFVGSLVGMGIGFGLCFISGINFNISTDYSVKEEEYIDMNDDMIIMNAWADDVEYVIEDRDNIRIEIYHSDFFVKDIEKNENYIHVGIDDNYDNVMEIIRKEIKDINDKKIVNYNSYKVKIYASSDNINKIKDNNKIID